MNLSGGNRHDFLFKIFAIHFKIVIYSKQFFPTTFSSSESNFEGKKKLLSLIIKRKCTCKVLISL